MDLRLLLMCCSAFPLLTMGTMVRPKTGSMLFSDEEINLGRNDNFTYTHWFTQKLDHFNPLDQRTFQQRYMTKSKHYKPGGPIFFIFGAEQKLGPWYIWENVDITRNAIKYGAMLYALEHRYYGDTHPTPDVSTENLQYLSSYQALEDAALFIESIKSSTGMYNAKVVVFGGSYAGGLASWFRLKYPHIADGAVASSANSHSELDFSVRVSAEYMDVVKKDMEIISPGCNSIVKEAFSSLNTMILQGNGYQVQRMFNTCTSFDLSDSYYRQGFFQTIIDLFQENAQYNGQGPNKLASVCNVMKNTTLGSLVNRLAALFQPEKNCLAANYKEYLKLLMQTSWDGYSVKNGDRLWKYQKCTEFGFFQTTDSKNQPFGSTISLPFMMDIDCMKTFGILPSTIQTAVNQHNQFYGGYGMKSNWVVFPNGSIDPWHVNGILQDINPTSIAVFMNGTSHCQDMGSPKPTDSAALIAGRRRIHTQIGIILAQKNNHN